MSLHFYSAYNYLLELKGEKDAIDFCKLYLKPKKTEDEISMIKHILLGDEVNLKAQEVLKSYYTLIVNDFNSLFRNRNSMKGSQDYFIDLINYVISRHK